LEKKTKSKFHTFGSGLAESILLDHIGHVDTVSKVVLLSLGNMLMASGNFLGYDFYSDGI